MPLHTVDEELLQEAAREDPGRIDPGVRPAPRPLPTAGEVVSTFNAAGCHGDPWFRPASGGGLPALASCPDHARCSDENGLDLGEVSMSAEGAGSATTDLLRADTPVASVSFRKPSERAALVAMCALAADLGPWYVFADVDGGAIVLPGDTPEVLEGSWPW